MKRLWLMACIMLVLVSCNKSENERCNELFVTNNLVDPTEKNYSVQCQIDNLSQTAYIDSSGEFITYFNDYIKSDFIVNKNKLLVERKNDLFCLYSLEQGFVFDCEYKYIWKLNEQFYSIGDSDNRHFIFNAETGETTQIEFAVSRSMGSNFLAFDEEGKGVVYDEFFKVKYKSNGVVIYYTDNEDTVIRYIDGKTSIELDNVVYKDNLHNGIIIDLEDNSVFVAEDNDTYFMYDFKSGNGFPFNYTNRYYSTYGNLYYFTNRHENNYAYIDNSQGVVYRTGDLIEMFSPDLYILRIEDQLYLFFDSINGETNIPINTSKYYFDPNSGFLYQVDEESIFIHNVYSNEKYIVNSNYINAFPMYGLVTLSQKCYAIHCGDSESEYIIDTLHVPYTEYVTEITMHSSNLYIIKYEIQSENTSYRFITFYDTVNEKLLWDPMALLLEW